MAEGEPPRFKKLVFDLLRDHVFSDTPAWVIINDSYNDCVRKQHSDMPADQFTSLLLQQCADLLEHPDQTVVAGAAIVLAKHLPAAGHLIDQETWLALVQVLSAAAARPQVEAFITAHKPDALDCIGTIVQSAREGIPQQLHPETESSSAAQARTAAAPVAAMQADTTVPTPVGRVARLQSDAPSDVSGGGALPDVSAQRTAKSAQAAGSSSIRLVDLLRDTNRQFTAAARSRKQLANAAPHSAASDSADSAGEPAAAAAAHAATPTCTAAGPESPRDLLEQLLRLARAAQKVRLAAGGTSETKQAPAAAAGNTAQRQQQAALLLRQTAAVLLPVALQEEEEAWDMGASIWAQLNRRQLPNTRKQQLRAGLDAVDECLAVLRAPNEGAVSTAAADAEGAGRDALAAADAEAAAQRMPAGAAANSLEALSMLLQGLTATSRHLWDNLAMSHFPVTVRLAMELQQRLLLLVPLAASAAAAAPAAACDGLIEAAAASVQSIVLLSLEGKGDDFRRREAIIRHTPRLLVPIALLQAIARVLVRRCSRAAAAVPAAALRPLCAVLKAGAAWQQTDAIVAHLVQKEIGSREFLMPSSLKALGRPAHHQDVVAHVIDEAVSTLAEASQQLLGGALGTRRPDAVARITTQLAQCGVPTALAAALALPLFATAAPAARTTKPLDQDSAVRAAGGPQHPRRPAVLAAAHAAAGFASTVELLRAPHSTDKDAQPLHDSVVKAAVAAAGAMLAFSHAFHDEKERKLQEAGARFAGTGASVLAGLLAAPGGAAAPAAAQQVAHTAAVQLLEWLPRSNAMSRDLLCDSLTVLGATAACAAQPDAAQRLTDALRGVKERMPPRLATEMNPRLQAAMASLSRQQREAVSRVRPLSRAAAAAAELNERIKDERVTNQLRRKKNQEEQRALKEVIAKIAPDAVDSLD